MAPNRKQKNSKHYSKCDNCPYPHLNTCFGETIAPCTIDKQTVLQHLQHALQELYREHHYLIDIKANEVNIAAHLWYCFKHAFGDVYSGLDIDMEYNRNGIDPKYYAMITGEDLSYAKPDMIIHKRGCNKHNFLYVEIKGHWNRRARELQQDIRKLKAFTKQDVLLEGEDRKLAYRYKYGAALRLFPEYVEVTWYEDGERSLFNEIELSDITAVNDYPPFCDEEQPDNIRIYIPLDLNHRAMLRRLNDIYRRYGYPTYKNESNFWQETEHVISQLEIYDQVWSVRDGRMGNGHSKKATEVAKEMLAILESDEGTAECFPFNVIEDLKREYELD